MNLIKLSGRKEGSPQCNMDPTKIILENVGRNFNGNYSCQVMRTSFLISLSKYFIIFEIFLIMNSVALEC